MKHSATRELYDYWNRQRGNRAAPLRTMIEPADIRGLLGDTFILEVGGPMNFPFRLAGTRLCASHGRELKGKNFLGTWSGDDIEAIATLLSAVSTDAAAAVLGVESFNARGQFAPMEMVLLPLSQTGTGFDRILGIASPLERVAWLGAEPIVRQKVMSLRLLWPDERPHFMRQNDAHLMPPAAPLPRRHPERRTVANPPSATRPRPHLVVLDGGKS